MTRLTDGPIAAAVPIIAYQRAPSRAASANGPFGGTFGVAIAPEQMVAGWDITPLNQHLIAVETPGGLGMVIAPRGDRSALRRPRGPGAPRGLGGAHVLAVLDRQRVHVCQPRSQFYAHCAGEKSGEKVLHVGLGQIEVDVALPAPAVAKMLDAPTPSHAACAIE
jgi:hypothetical protein